MRRQSDADAGAGAGAGTTLVLDVDGVLLDPTRHGSGSRHVVLQERYGVDAHQLRSAFFERDWPDIIVGNTAIEPALAGVIEELDWPLTVEELLACWFESDFVVNHEVVEAAAAWADGGTRLGVATNQEHRRARFLEQRLGDLLPISGIAYSAAIGFVKQDPRFFPGACDALGISRDDTTVVFVDDGSDNVEAAQAHGWTAVHFTPDDDWRPRIETALRSSARGAGHRSPTRTS